MNYYIKIYVLSNLFRIQIDIPFEYLLIINILSIYEMISDIMIIICMNAVHITKRIYQHRHVYHHNYLTKKLMFNFCRRNHEGGTVILFYHH